MAPVTLVNALRGEMCGFERQFFVQWIHSLMILRRVCGKNDGKILAVMLVAWDAC